MRKILALALPLLFVSLMTIQVSATMVGSGNGAIVILDEPNYPYQLVVLGDTNTGLTVDIALKENGFTLEGGEVTLTDGLMAWLPEQAMNFKQFPIEPDTIALRGDVPVAVWMGDVIDIFNALIAQNWDFLNARLQAQGIARGQWTEKSDVSAMNRVCGAVTRIDGSTAILIALWIGKWDETFTLTNEIAKVELH